MGKRNTALKLAGAVAVATAGYHAYDGDRTIKAIEMSPDDMDFVSSTFQLGTMGWVAGGVLLVAASRITDQTARNWIVGVTAALYGLPALGTLTLTGGEINTGGVMLATATALALYGRKLDSSTEALPKIAAARELART